MQDNLDKDEYIPLTKAENFKIFGMLAVFGVIWLVLFLTLPKSVVIGYFVVMALIVGALWLRPRKEDNSSS